MHTRDGAVPRIALKVDEFTQVRREAGMDNPTACATRLGLGRTTVARAEQRRIDPGVRFIAATLAAFPEHRFEDLFDVIGPDGERVHARDNDAVPQARGEWICPECGHLNAAEQVVCEKTPEHD